jgi:hypothetical protein
MNFLVKRIGEPECSEAQAMAVLTAIDAEIEAHANAHPKVNPQTADEPDTPLEK